MADLRLRAITEIHRAKKAGVAGDRAKGIAPIAPVTEVIEPRKLFNAKDQDEYDSLTAGRYPAAAPAPVGDDEGAAAKTTEPEGDDEVLLEAMTKAQLVAYAKDAGIEHKSKITAADLLALIQAAEADEDAGDGEADEDAGDGDGEADEGAGDGEGDDEDTDEENLV